MKFLSCVKGNVLSIFLSNIQSLVPKIDEVRVVAATKKPDIIVFCETWLTDMIDDDFLHIPGYCAPYRDDRISRRGGGVCLYFKSSLTCLQLNPRTKPSCIECVWVAFPVQQIVLLVMYVPPSLTSLQYNEVIDFIIAEADNAMNHINDSKLIVVGDLNQLPTRDVENTLGLQQIVDTPTRGNAILDQILLDSRLLNEYKTPIVGPNIGKADHLSVYLSPVCHQATTTKIKKVYDFRESNIMAFTNALKMQRWEDFYRSQESLETKCEIFYEKIEKALSVIPCHFIQMTPRDKPWVTPILKHLINCRYEAYRNRQMEKYEHYKTKVKNEIQKAKSLWIDKLKTSKGGIWKAVRTITTGTVSDDIQNVVGEKAPLTIANELNSIFSSVFTGSTLTDASVEELVTVDASWCVNINTGLVSELLRNLKLGKAPGSDGLNPAIMKRSSDVLAGPLTHLFSLSVSTGEVPSRWKLANIAPLPKKSRPSIRDFRPISLLPIPSKMLEMLVLRSVKTKLLTLYGSNQFGFRPGSSTLDAHLAMQDFVTRQLDISSVKFVVMIALDLSKAFDRLSHLSLLKTMSAGGMPRKFISWLRSFLTGRSQKVVFQGMISSNTENVTSGVPQGSVLAPYLFASHVGSLEPLHSNTRLIKFADDITLLLPHVSHENADSFLSMIQAEVNNIELWCLDHGLSINHQKTKTIIFKKASPPQNILQGLWNVSLNIKVLGIIFDQALNWDTHVDTITKSAGRRINVLRHLRQISAVSKKDLLEVYQNYILSVLEYNCPLLIGMSRKNNEKLERLRKRSHRIICGTGCDCDAFVPLHKRRLQFSLNVFKKMLSPLNISHDLLPHRLPRTGHFFVEPIKTARRAKSFVPYLVLHCNNSL